MSAVGRQLGRARMYKNGRRAAFCLALAVLLLAAPAVAGSEVAEPEVQVAVLRASLPLSFTGGAEATTTHGLLHADLPDGDEALLMRLDAAEAKVNLYTVTRSSAGVLGNRPGVLDRLGLGNSEEADVVRVGPLSEAWMSLDGAPRGTYMLARTVSPGDAVFASTMDGTALLDDLREETTISYRASPGPHDDSQTLPASTFGFHGAGALYSLRGDFQLVLHGLDFSLFHAEGREDYHTGTTASESPFGGDPVELPGAQQMTQYAVIELRGAELLLRASEPQALYAASGAMRILVDGRMTSPGIAGGIRVGSDIVHAAGDAAQLTGRFTVVPSGNGDGNAVMRLEGDVQTLTVGPQSYAAGTDVVRKAAGVMVVLAGAAAVAWHLGKSGVVFPLYAKLTRRKVLDQGTRNLVYLKVQQDPGVTTKAIAEVLDVSWSTAAYHLRVLRHMGLVTARRRGRHEHHFVAGERSLGEQEIMAALRHPTTRRIARLVTREPGIIQKEICTRLGIAPSTASDHLRRLKDLGAIREVQDWRTRSYHPGDGLRRVTGESVEASAALAPMQHQLVPVATATLGEQGA